MKNLQVQIKALSNQLEEQRAELAENAEAFKAELGKPGMLLKGFLVGFAIGYFILPRKKFQQAVNLEQNMEGPNKPVPSSFRDHLAAAVSQHLPSENWLVNAAQILKFL